MDVDAKCAVGSTADLDQFLYSAVFSPHERSLADLFNQTPSQLPWEAFSHAALNARGC